MQPAPHLPAFPLTPSWPWALSVPVSPHCASFSSKNRSFNLGRTINWDEKSEVWGGISASLSGVKLLAMPGSIFAGVLPPPHLRPRKVQSGKEHPGKA